MSKRYNKGLIVGKFYPFHNGHKYLIETSILQCKTLIVMVTSLPTRELIPADIRAEWIRETFPDLDVRVIEDIGYDDDSKQWADYTISLLGKAPDVVFTSEDYGNTWAKELGCAHVQVDKKRATYPISGTAVRENPLKNWRYLPPATRAYFAPRVVLIGAESTGKSTLALQLAQCYKTNLVHEYGRYYSELREHNHAITKRTHDTYTQAWNERDFIHIAHTQTLIENQLAESTNKLLICDTDAFATQIWHYRYTGKWSTRVLDHERSVEPMLYIVTPPDIPFTQDGTRDGQLIRTQMHEWVLHELSARHKNFVVVEGAGNQKKRLQNAVKEIEKAKIDWVKQQRWATRLGA